MHDQENVGEPAPKRRRISRNSSQDSEHDSTASFGSNDSISTTTYGAELVVYDRHSRYFLYNAVYFCFMNFLCSHIMIIN